ncbi:TonB-dependent receptor [Psychrobacter sp. I-STPA10]|uniref:TonB-dependent receptor n=1 Tax=Psychrobacter sp. I-STPA10 TaxID=2585769 RepID=UPI001E3B6040|nr:TonB-dependent receptor [Psychrobacter sp. I-STPA10]
MQASACTAIALTSMAHAQQASSIQINNDTSDSLPSTTVAPIVVTASRSNAELGITPQTVEIISENQIQNQLDISSNSSDVLSNLLPSYTPSRSKMNGSGETLRGRTPLIMIDGVPQSNPLRPTGREAHSIDFSMVERVEVIHGANASNGMGATGGVINIITKKPYYGKTNQHLSVQVTAPTEKTDSENLNYKASYGINGAGEKIDYLLSLSYEDQGQYLDAKGRAIGVDNTQGDLMDSQAYDVLAKLGYQIDDNQHIQASVNRYQIKNKNTYTSVAGDRDKGIPTTSEKKTPPGEAPHNDVWTSSIRYENYDLAGMQLDAMVFNQEFEGLFGATDSNTFQDPKIAPEGTLYDQSRAKTSKIGSKVSLTKDDLLNSRLKLTAGFDTVYDQSKQDLYLTNRTYVPLSKYTSYSPFIQAEAKVTDNLTLHGGARKEIGTLDTESYRTVARYNNVLVKGGKLDFDENLYNAGIVYSPIDNTTVFANYSEGYSMPDVGRALRSIKKPGLSIENLKQLKPILTKNIETGVRLNQEDTNFELSLFQSSSDFGDRSKYDAKTDAFLMSREKTRIRGLETSISQKIDNHALKLAYSHIEGKYDSNDDGNLDKNLNGLNVGPNRLIASWGTKWTDNLSTYLQANHAFKRNFDGQNLDFGGYTLVDASVAYKLPKGTASLAVSNLLDKDYITYYSQSALANNDRYFAGRGRTVTLGYSVDF